MRTIDDCIAAIGRWIESGTVPRPKGEQQGVIRVIEGGPVGVVDGVPIKLEFENGARLASGTEPTGGGDAGGRATRVGPSSSVPNTTGRHRNRE